MFQQSFMIDDMNFYFEMKMFVLDWYRFSCVADIALILLECIDYTAHKICYPCIG